MGVSATKQKLSDASSKLDTQNEVIEVMDALNNPTGRVSIAVDGDFDSGVVEVGYKTALGVFIMFTDATSSAAEQYTLKVGQGRVVFARATGASPAINISMSAYE